MNTFKMIQSTELGKGDVCEAIVLDVRTGMEHAEQRLKLPHVNIPLGELNVDDFLTRHGLDKNSPVVVVCRSGKRSQRAAEMLCQEGMTNVYVVDGGILSCVECGHETEGHLVSTKMADGTTVKGPISLERQMRIVAGAIAGAGLLLGIYVNPYFFAIPLFVSGGLIFAGVTDRCGMALLLTKAPWNRIEDPASSQEKKSQPEKKEQEKVAPVAAEVMKQPEEVMPEFEEGAVCQRKI